MHSLTLPNLLSQQLHSSFHQSHNLLPIVQRRQLLAQIGLPNLFFELFKQHHRQLFINLMRSKCILYKHFHNLFLPNPIQIQHTLEQKLTFYPEMTKNFVFEKCEFCKKGDFENVNFVKKKNRIW